MADAPVQTTPDDTRLKRIRGVVSRHSRRPDALIEILHAVQESYGYVPQALMEFLAAELRIPPSRIYGVVTFYHFFSTKPKGDHTCVVCMGTACHVKGSKEVLDGIEDAYGVKAGATTPDKKLSVQTARCLGCCSLGPVAVLDDQILPRVRAEELVAKLRARIGDGT